MEYPENNTFETAITLDECRAAREDIANYAEDIASFLLADF
jgi:hypothetical protein|tara:strand:+ start:9855 stop:9977 length:123 start_codon:yes stop_codon:yes gene_type:complete